MFLCSLIFKRLKRFFGGFFFCSIYSLASSKSIMCLIIWFCLCFFSPTKTFLTIYLFIYNWVNYILVVSESVKTHIQDPRPTVNLYSALSFMHCILFGFFKNSFSHCVNLRFQKKVSRFSTLNIFLNWFCDVIAGLAVVRARSALHWSKGGSAVISRFYFYSVWIWICWCVQNICFCHLRPSF